MSTPVVDEIGEQLDRQLLEILTLGQVVIGSDGKPVMGPDGKTPIRKPPSAAVLGQARQRVNDRRKENHDKYRETSEVERIMADIHGEELARAQSRRPARQGEAAPPPSPELDKAREELRRAEQQLEETPP